MKNAKRKGEVNKEGEKKEIGKEEDGITKLFWYEILHLHDTFFFKNVARKFEKRIPRWD